MAPLLEAHISADYFNDADHQRVYAYIQRHYADHGEVPLRAMIKKEWPTYQIVKVEHGIAWYIKEIRKQYMYDMLLEGLSDVRDYMDEKDPEAVLRTMQMLLADAAPVMSAAVDEDLTKTWEPRLDKYAAIRDSGGALVGLPTGFQTIDRATNGLQRKQLITLVGLPKAGKSTLLLAIAKNCHEYGARPLFIGFEMTNDEQGARYDSMVAKVDSMSLLGGHMTSTDEDTLEKVGREREDGLPPFVVSTDISSATTVSGIGAKIDQYQPTIVFIDGAYLMDDEHGEPKGSSAALTNITRALKRLAQQKNVPIVITTQVLASKVSRATGVQASSVGYSSSFAQDSDTLIAVESTEEDGVQLLKVLLSRNGPTCECEVEWDWATGTFEELDGDEEEEKEAA